MKCDRCENERIVLVSGKCSDLFSCSFGDDKYQGEVPKDLGIGGGDYMSFEYCAECGKIQGEFPIEVNISSEKEEEWE